MVALPPSPPLFDLHRADVERECRLAAARHGGEWREYLGAAWEGFEQACRRYDPSRGDLWAFASDRVRGAIRDSVRVRSVRRGRGAVRQRLDADLPDPRPQMLDESAPLPVRRPFRVTTLPEPIADLVEIVADAGKCRMLLRARPYDVRLDGFLLFIEATARRAARALGHTLAHEPKEGA